MSYHFSTLAAQFEGLEEGKHQGASGEEAYLAASQQQKVNLSAFPVSNTPAMGVQAPPMGVFSMLMVNGLRIEADGRSAPMKA